MSQAVSIEPAQDMANEALSKMDTTFSMTYEIDLKRGRRERYARAVRSGDCRTLLASRELKISVFAISKILGSPEQFIQMYRVF